MQVIVLYINRLCYKCYKYVHDNVILYLINMAKPYASCLNTSSDPGFAAHL